MTDETHTFVSVNDGAVRPELSWCLALALSSDEPRAPARRLLLRGADRVTIGRGRATGWQRRDGGRLIELTIADRWASQAHARLIRERTLWRVEDLGSRNGTRLNGARIDVAELKDGDVIECGGTFLVARGAPPGADASDLDAPTGPHPSLSTVSPTYQQLVTLLSRIAAARVPVLLGGDTGTGKEVAARAIHELSGRTGSFVAVNCAALPQSILASELFGVKRGAFSGAEQDRPGLVRTADGGTLFLDEIGELGVDQQAALLRVLQEHEVLPVGATKPVRVDLRVIAATNRSLEELTASGRFRRDLLARLRGYSLVLPPLCQRREDLGLLVGSLLDQIEAGRPRRFSRAAARALFLHPWPLHVRELEQALRAATAIADGDTVDLEDLPDTVRASAVVEEVEPPDPAMTRERFAEVVATHAGNTSQIARVLGTSRSQVRRLAARWHVDLRGARGA